MTEEPFCGLKSMISTSSKSTIETNSVHSVDNKDSSAQGKARKSKMQAVQGESDSANHLSTVFFQVLIIYIEHFFYYLQHLELKMISLGKKKN
jgi:hypothetical protein